ncbi:hypothetical protein GUITHDRAFT_109033 [Guillardia theta CCMP2712]|uniref:Uncharacterized protein n=2 Tax=Guillardia theta TaxID=55529 RepID=L1J9J0_GUITC|nr:hypothetical protein GUITHDRAFT_109033 [Guillardia theta CCMP2712]EKX44987.1 hypothetical protein GUITHDRAFT_109033 [Guillardia theta CCMP2712]|mmetsp:Transcript_36369/g.113380  ORF Transcript_36369/g.113380 Transcript_36369/m.113380 type:complete len:217 (+) Transcript_36369:150-800(+)|eukprot:XP_005831967.1 hypothetical protein GUITHDRAFT_109033 [Guillardia theta CCMP2712]
MTSRSLFHSRFNDDGSITRSAPVHVQPKTSNFSSLSTMMSIMMEDSIWLDRHQNEVLQKRKAASCGTKIEVLDEEDSARPSASSAAELESQFNMDFVPPAENHFVIDEFVRGERSTATEKTMGLIMRFTHTTGCPPLAGKRRIEDEQNSSAVKKRATRDEQSRRSSSFEDLGLDHCMLDGVEEDLAGEASLSATLKGMRSSECSHCVDVTILKKVD